MSVSNKFVCFCLFVCLIGLGAAQAHPSLSERRTARHHVTSSAPPTLWRHKFTDFEFRNSFHGLQFSNIFFINMLKKQNLLFSPIFRGDPFYPAHFRFDLCFIPPFPGRDVHLKFCSDMFFFHKVIVFFVARWMFWMEVLNFTPYRILFRFVTIRRCPRGT